MRDRFHEYIDETCPLYTQDIMSKVSLLDKEKWYNKSYDNMTNHTNGTTGPIFQYLIWKDIYDFIERECHYKYIADEFDIHDRPIVFNMLNNTDYPYLDTSIIDSGHSDIIINTHGISNSYVYTAVKGSYYYNDINSHYNNIIEFLKSTKVDIILSSGDVINSLVNYMKKTNYSGKLCTLLSNTCESYLDDDIRYISNFVTYFCDHMRCWDGGATFFTCKYNTYHICDNLAYSRSINNKLITDDYFSVCSPFFNYWNGDYVKIDDNIQLCKCGRYYRNFEFVKSRPFTISNMNSNTIKEIIKSSGIHEIKIVKCDRDKITITTTKQPSQESTQKIQESLPKFKVIYEIVT